MTTKPTYRIGWLTTVFLFSVPLTILAASTISIDATWLTNNIATYGGPPYVLTSSNTTYVLQTNVTVNGTAFLVLNNDVTLQLNGQTITYDNLAMPTISNAWFNVDAIGSTTVSGWNLVGPAATSRIITASSAGPLGYPVGMNVWGTQNLKLSLSAGFNGLLSIGSGNTATITATNHGLSTGDTIFLNGFDSAPAVGGQIRTVTKADNNSFTINGITLTAVNTAAGYCCKATLIESSDIAITHSNVYYAAYLIAASPNAGTYPQAQYLEVIQNGAALPAMDPTTDQAQNGYVNYTEANWRNYGSVSVIKPPTTANLKLRLWVGNLCSWATAPIDVYIGRARLATAYMPAIVVPGQWSGQYPPFQNWPSAIQALYHGYPFSGFTLQDTDTGPLSTSGAIVQGGGGFRSMAVEDINDLGAIVVRDLQIALNGDESIPVWLGQWSGDSNKITVGGAGRGLVITLHTNLVMANRMGMYPAICVANPLANVEISNNTITDNPHSGIAVGNATRVLVSNNTIYPRNTAPNGYAISCNGNAQILNNVVDALARTNGSGRGMYLGSAYGVLHDLEIGGNTFRIRESSYPEPSLDVRSLRMRNNQDGFNTDGAITNINVHDNLFESTAQTGLAMNVYGAMVSVLLPTKEATISQSGADTIVTFDYNQDPNWGASFQVYLIGFNSTPTANGLRTLTQISGGQFKITGLSLSAITQATGRIGQRSLIDAMNRPNNIVFSNNIFRSIAQDVSQTAKALVIDDSESAGVALYNNIYDSNQFGVAIGDGDSGFCDQNNLTFIGGTVSKNTTYPGGVTMPAFYSWAFGYNAADYTNDVIMGQQYTGGASPTNLSFALIWQDQLQDSRTVLTDIDFGWLLNVMVHDGAAQVVTGANITVTDRNAATVFTGTTDGTGQISNIQVVTQNDHLAPGLNNLNAMIITPLTPHTITISKNGITTSQSISLTNNQTVALTLYTPRQSWRSLNGLPVDGSGIGADTNSPANDGIANLMKYALDIPAFTRGYQNHFSANITNLAAQNYLTLSYTRTNPAPADISYYVETASDLVLRDWSTNQIALINILTNGKLATLTYRDAQSIASTNKGFLRLRITTNP